MIYKYSTQSFSFVRFLCQGCGEASGKRLTWLEWHAEVPSTDNGSVPSPQPGGPLSKIGPPESPWHEPGPITVPGFPN